MPEYRRNRVPGGTYFITVNLLDRRSDLLVTHIGLLRASVSRVRHLMPFHIDAWVVLPDHMHALWTLPDGNVDFSKRWQAIKMAFSKAIDPAKPCPPAAASAANEACGNGVFGTIPFATSRTMLATFDYTHFNPVKHGLAPSAAAWPYSTFHRAVAEGQYPSSWSAAGIDASDKGERSC